jgi:hypothetical protein
MNRSSYFYLAAAVGAAGAVAVAAAIADEAFGFALLDALAAGCGAGVLALIGLRLQREQRQ